MVQGQRGPEGNRGKRGETGPPGPPGLPALYLWKNTWEEWAAFQVRAQNYNNILQRSVKCEIEACVSHLNVLVDDEPNF